MTYVLDTDIAIGYLKGDSETVRKVLGLTEVFTTVATVAELFYGVYNSDNPKRHKSKLLDFLGGVYLLGFDSRSAEIFGRIKAELRKKGKLACDFDITIASICMANDCTLLTNNLKHYQNIDKLKVLQFSSL